MMNFYKIFKHLGVLLFALPLMLTGQVVTKNIVIVNGGDYSDPDDYVTVAVYHPQTQTTETIATIFTQSTQGLLADDGYAFVAAQDSLAKIKIESGEREAVVALAGVNKFAVYEDKLIVSRQYPATSGFVQIRSVDDLELIAEISEISDESWDIIVAQDTAYVSVAGGWAATVGKLAVIDLVSNAFVREMDLGEQAVGIGPSFQKDNEIWFVCKTPWGGSSGNIIRYGIATAAYDFFPCEHVLGKAAGLYGDKLYLVTDGNVGVFDLAAQTVSNPSLIPNPFGDLAITALTLDTVNEMICVNYSGWSAGGTGKIYDLTGVETGTYEVGISAEEVAVNYIDVTGIERAGGEADLPLLFPNPCRDELHVAGAGNKAMLSVLDLSGRLLLQQRAGASGTARIGLSKMSAGTYVLRISDGNGENSLKFIRQ